MNRKDANYPKKVAEGFNKSRNIKEVIKMVVSPFTKKMKGGKW